MLTKANGDEFGFDFDDFFRKRGVIIPIAGIDHSEYINTLDEVYNISPADNDYRYCVSAETYRPIPHTYERSEKMVLLHNIFAEFYPQFLKRIIKHHLKRTVVTVERGSRTGFPYLTFMKDGDEKKLTVESIANDPKGFMTKHEKRFVVTNVRLQPEKLTKERVFQFVRNGMIVEDTIDKSKRAIKFGDTTVYGSRVRLVFNYPVITLVNQIVDTIIHDAYVSLPVFHHNMFSFPYDSISNGFDSYEEDISHYERILGDVVSIRGQIIGGLYHEINQYLLKSPFLVKDEISGEFYFYSPKLVQLGSGLSCVAPLGKEVNILVTIYAYMKATGFSFDEAMTKVIFMSDPDIIFPQFGDDYKMVFRLNHRGIDLSEKMKTVRAEILTTKKEEPGKFLGFKKHYSDGAMKNRLSLESCFLNLFCDERPPFSSFRRFPCFGYFERRKVYKQFGEPGIDDYLAKEEKLFKDKLWWSYYLRKAEYERSRLSSNLSANYVLGKTYLLTKEEKVRLNLASVISADVVKRVLSQTFDIQL